MQPSYKQSRFLRLTAVVLLPTLALAQQPKSAPDSVLEALLSEVRQLRIVLERSTTLMPKMQLAVSRFQIQQERVDRQERELRIAHQTLITEQIGKDRMILSLRQFEEQARQTGDNAVRKQAEEAAASLRADLEQQAAREQQARAQETEATSQLRIEQARLNDLAEQLDRLDKIVSRQP